MITITSMNPGNEERIICQIPHLHERPRATDFDPGLFADRADAEQSEDFLLAGRMYRSLAEDDTRLVEIWEMLSHGCLDTPEFATLLRYHHCHSLPAVRAAAGRTLARHLAIRLPKFPVKIRETMLEVFLAAPGEWPEVRVLDISSSRLERRRLSGLQLDNLNASGTTFENETLFENCHFQNADFSSAHCRQIWFDHVTGVIANFAGADLTCARWRNCGFKLARLDRARLGGFQSFACTGLTPPPDAKMPRSPRCFRLEWRRHDYARPCNASAISGDGKRIVTALQTGELEILNEHGERLRLLDTQTGGGITAVAFSANGSVVAAQLMPGDAILRWDAETGKRLSGWGEYCRDGSSFRGNLALSANGAVALSSAGGQWGRLPVDLLGDDDCPWKRDFNNPETCSAMTPDAQTVLTGNRNGEVRIWQQICENRMIHWQSHLLCADPDDPIEACALSADGTRAFLAGSKKAGRIVDCHDGDLRKIILYNVPLSSCALDGDGRAIVFAANDGAIVEGMGAKKMSTFHLRVPDFFSAACSISVDGTRAVVSTNENTAFIFDAIGRKLVLRDNEDFELADALRLHPNWRINANLDDSGRFLSDEDGDLVRILRNSSDGWWRKTAMSADGCSLLAGEDDGTFRVFDDKGRATLAFQISTPDHLRGLACDFATKRLLFCDGNGNTSLWSLETGKRLKVISGKSKIFQNYVLSDADNSLLFSLAAVPPSLWDRHGYCLPSLREMRFKAIGASGNRVLVAEKDDLLLFEGGNLLEKRSGLYGVQWMSIPMTADGRIILLWKNEKTALLCDDHLRTFHTLKHRAEISAATLTADGALAAIATNGGVVFLWGTDGTQRQILRGHCLPVRQLAFSADGSTLMAATRSTIRHWRRDEDGVFRCVLELRTESGTRIWLDAETQSLRVDGPDWPHLQLHRSDGAPARSGESIADFGPLAHQRLVNADEWLFAPRDDMG